MADELADPTREPRFDVDIAVDCHTCEMFVANHVTNISRGGVFIKGAHPLPLNSEVNLRFHLPEVDVTIRATGRVVWNYDIARGTSRVVPGSGIKFVRLAPSDRAAIESYLERLTARRSVPKAPAANACA